MGTRGKRTTWTEAEISTLGQIPDQKIADQKSISLFSVAQKRKSLAINPSQPKKKWNPEEIAFLGSDTDAAIAKKLGRSRESVMLARTGRGIKRRHTINIPSFSELKNLEQSNFFEELRKYYKSKNNETLTYQKVSKMCFWSISRLQKWFTPGSAQQPLALAVRHHIWLSVIYFKK